MAHAAGWDARRKVDRLYRNRFVTAQDGKDYPTVERLVARGLMVETRQADTVVGGMATYSVTDRGIELLAEYLP